MHSTWTLVAFIVLDICESGKRSIFCHDERAVVTNDNVTELFNPCELPLDTEKWEGSTEME